MSEVNVGYSRTHRWRIGSDSGVAVAVGVAVGLVVTAVVGVLRIGVVTGADVTGRTVVGMAVGLPDVPDESVHPAARRTAIVMIVREKSGIILIVHQLYHDPIILLFSLPKGALFSPTAFLHMEAGYKPGNMKKNSCPKSLNRHAVQG